MKLHLKLFLCFMISLEQAAGEDPLFPEYETPGSHQEPETLITPERVHKDQVPADGGSKVSNHGIPTDDRISKTAKPKVEKKIYVDEKCCNLSTTSYCLKKGGDCVPNNETCHGKEYSGSKYCVISDLKSCKCCVPTDCEEATLEPCKLLNGTCKGDHEDCKDDESSVSGAEFCKYKTCKCCFPKDTPPCPCGQDFEGGCTGYRDKESYRGHCMKTCEPETISLPVHKCDQLGGADCKCCAETGCPKICVGVHKEKEYDGVCRFGGCLSMETKTQRCPNSNCDCCIHVPVSPFSCNETHPEEYDCSLTKTEFIGPTYNVAQTSIVPFTSGMTIGIRMLPEDVIHEVIVYAEAPGYPDGVFKIRLDERSTPWVDSQNTVYHWIIHRWTPNINAAWHGSWIQCIPKNEWLLLTITDQYNGNVEYELHGYYSYTMGVSLPTEGFTIRVDTGSSNSNSEISLACPPKK